MKRMKLICGGLVLAALLGCERDPGPKAPDAKSTGELVQPAPPPPTSPPLTAYGWGAVTVGMDEAAAVAAGLHLPEIGKAGAECHFLASAGYPGLLAMVENGRVTRITVRENPTLRTDRNLGVGSTAAEVRATYGSDLVSLPHKYEASPAAYLTPWALPEKRGIRYVTNGAGVVTEIHAGSDAIELVEGCG